MPHDGDLGQTFDSNRTLTHYESNPIKGQTVLFVGDLSYADKYPLHDKNRWDTWGRFGEGEPFKPYTHRYFVPYEASGSTSPLWYSIKRASAYIIVLSSYSAYGKSTPQYKWLTKELPKVNRSETPWLIVVMHCPLGEAGWRKYNE
ncbi:putative metallo-dependent phosphatase, purple acid phosphatase [Helianthus annuus]|nr:putative metallo-dependent phosphatase, purple acid phosphatase [Helianthus annuus]KAJ0939594.1 putative metallo-dependent phosphatase, purple acid phosphatase [Helianthus annuus]